MNWQTAIALYIVFGLVVARFFQKKAADTANWQKLLVWQFIGAASLSVIYYFYQGAALGLWWHPLMPWVIALGILNGIANHFHWSALRLSLTKTSVLTQFDDISAVALSLIFLGEFRLLTQPPLLLGTALCFGSAWLFLMEPEEKALLHNRIIFHNVLRYGLLWGITGFAMRYLALYGLPAANFLASWYGTSFLTVALVLRVTQGKWPGLVVSRKQALWSLGAGVAIFVSLRAMFHARAIAPVTISQPLVLVAEMVIPSLIGWYIFHEGRKLSPTEKYAALVGVAGGIILAFAYRGG